MALEIHRLLIRGTEMTKRAEARSIDLPLLRPGDSIQTAISVHFETGGMVGYRYSCRSVKGGVGSTGFGVFEGGCREVAKRVFGDAALTSQVLHENTLFGALSRGMATAAFETTVKLLVNGTSSPSARSINRYLRFRFAGLVVQGVRSCSVCIREDIDQQGFAAWRVLHQLSQVDRCVYHGHPLILEVLPIGVTRKALPAVGLPSGEAASRALNANRTIPHTFGYASYLSGWLRAFRGELPQLAEDRWIETLVAAQRIAGGPEALLLALKSHLTSRWEASLHEIADNLTLEGGEDFLAQELRWITHPGCVARRLLILGAIEELGIASLPLAEQGELEFEVVSKTLRASQKLDHFNALRSAIVNSGVGPAIYFALEQGISARDVAVAAGVSEDRVRTLVSAIPADLLLGLRASRSWPSGSWVETELRRRQLRKVPGTSRSRKRGRWIFQRPGEPEE